MINLSHINHPIGKLIEQYKTRKDVHNVFGVILYTARHPFVLKMLRDNDFWNALDEISGARWPIFAIRPAEGQMTRTMPRLPSGMRALMVPITKWREPSANRELLTTFNISDTRQLPLLLVFAEGRNGEALQISFKILDTDQDACFNSLRCAIEKCAEAIDKVTDENIKNTETIYGLMDAVHNQEMVVRWIRIGVSFAQWVKSFV